MALLLALTMRIVAIITKVAAIMLAMIPAMEKPENLFCIKLLCLIITSSWLFGLIFDIAYANIKVMKDADFSVRGLTALIAVFAVAIIGLSAGAVWVKMRVDDRKENTELTEEEISADAVEITKKIDELPAEEAIKYLDEKMVEYAGTDLEFSIILWKVGVYEKANMAREAIAFLEGLDMTDMSNMQKWYVYFELSGLYSQNGDMEMANYYSKKSEEAIGARGEKEEEVS